MKAFCEFCGNEWDGIYHFELQIGFAWLRGAAGNRVIRLDENSFMNNPPLAIEWSDLDSWVLKKIDERLKQV